MNNNFDLPKLDFHNKRSNYRSPFICFSVYCNPPHKELIPKINVFFDAMFVFKLEH